jgi:TetR/AcrR family transcriptional regulator, regulator of autoinduction and epiphytic fitness
VSRTINKQSNEVELDPRIERSRRVISEAVIAEMAEAGYGAMTVEAVAKRAGVSKATIYRQWSGKLGMIEAALDLLKDDMVLDQSAPPRERLTQLLTWLATHLGDPSNPVARCVPALVSASEYDAAVREFHHRFSAARRQVLIDILVEGQVAGEFAASLDTRLTSELLVGPVFYRRLMTGTPFPPSDVPKVVEAVLGAE